MDRDVAIVGLGVDPMQAVVLEQAARDRSERLARQTAPLMLGGERDADLGGRRLVGHDVHGAVAEQRVSVALGHGELHPEAGLTERDALLGDEQALGVGHRVRRVPRLVAGDLGSAAIGDEGRQVVRPERPQAQPRRDDLGELARDLDEVYRVG